MAQILKSTVLLVTDVQAALLRSPSDVTTLISNIVNAVATTRDHKIPVIYALVGLGYMNFGPKNFRTRLFTLATTFIPSFSVLAANSLGRNSGLPLALDLVCQKLLFPFLKERVIS
jgi:hypothetical protein